MKRYKVVFLPRAEGRLAAIEAYIAERASQAIAQRFVASLVNQALKLDSFPFRGTPRDDLMPGLRTIVHRQTVTITYVVDGDEVAVADSGIAARRPSAASVAECRPGRLPMFSPGKCILSPFFSGAASRG